MKLLVCIKQVPDMESRFRVSAAGDWFEESDLAFRVNEYDDYAVEQAVQLKEQLAGRPEITVLSVGPDRVGEALRKALAMGCDQGVHIRDPEAVRKDPWQIASLIAAYAKDKGFDLVLAGMQSQDRGSAQVGIMLAEILGYPSVSTLVGFSYVNGIVSAQRELEGGAKAVVRLPLPAVVTCQLGLNVPRYPTLPNIMKAKKKEILSLDVAELPGEAGWIGTQRLYSPAKKGGGLIIEGGVEEMADRLVAILKQKTMVLR